MEEQLEELEGNAVESATTHHYSNDNYVFINNTTLQVEDHIRSMEQQDVEVVYSEAAENAFG